jgi:hypothetical protein
MLAVVVFARRCPSPGSPARWRPGVRPLLGLATFILLANLIWIATFPVRLTN